jgi:glycosyltransferase involved in cell wall biosynthesis
LIDNASVLINPSAHESLSLIVLEAMARRRPVLVNGNCTVLDHYARETKTVFSYKDQKGFVNHLREILAINWDSVERKKDLDESADWVKKHYSWPSVFSAYESTITR